VRGRGVIAKLVVAGLAGALLVVSTDSLRAATAEVAPARRSHATASITIGGRQRTYVTVRPARPSRARLPVLVVLHGRTMSPAQTEEMTGFAPVVGPAITVYPAGYRDSWNAGACCGEAHAAGIDDVAFITGLVHHVLATEPDASPSHVYLAGYSNGGRMALRLACAAPDLFAGVAAVEAVSVYSCPHPRPVSLLAVASRDDPLLAVDASQTERVINGFHEPTVDGMVAGWRQVGACGDTPSTTVSGTLTERHWSGCRSHTRLAYALYGGGSHAWPSGDAQTPSAEQVIWTFFRGPGAGIT
jgi:poly(3-hydroxybutyrate) depolymerase